MAVRLWKDSQLRNIISTVLTTFSMYAVFLVQGIIVARILGATGRGEFGTALYFPRDILLYAGLLGSIDIVASHAARSNCDTNQLKRSAIQFGIFSGTLTAVVAAILSACLLIPTGKSYLLPFCLLCCLFVPSAHVQLNVAAVDRGKGLFFRYNVNRFVFAAAFPTLFGLAWLVGLDSLTGISWLWLVCGIFVISKFLGLLPTLRGLNLFSATRVAKLSTGETGVPSARALLRQGRPYAASVLMREIFERLDVFLIVALASVTQSGYYFVAIPAAALLTIVPNALSVFTFNAGANPNVVISKSQAAKVLIGTAVWQIASTTALALIIGPLILLMYTAEFSEAIPFALWLLPASAIKGFSQAADSYLKGRQKPQISFWARSLSIAIMLVFVAATFDNFGLIGIPMAACIGQAVSMVIIVTAIWIDVHQQNFAMDR